MNIHPIVTSAIILGLIAVAFIGLSLRGFIHRRPFSVSARWMFGLAVLSFTPGFLLLSDSFIGSDLSYIDVSSVLLLIIYAGLLLFLWYRLSGYIIIGVSSDDLRHYLLSALVRLELPYEERLSTLYLPSLPGDLQVVSQNVIHVAQLRIKESKERVTLSKIIAHLNIEFSENQVQFQPLTGVLYLLLGVFLLACAIFLAR